MTPFWLPGVVAIAAGAVFLLGTEARWWSKLAVATIVALSFVFQHAVASSFAWVTGLVLQVAVSVFVLVRVRAAR